MHERHWYLFNTSSHLILSQFFLLYLKEVQGKYGYRAIIPSPAYLQQPKFSNIENHAKSALKFTLLCRNTLETAIIIPDLKVLGEIIAQTPVISVGHQNQYFTFPALKAHFFFSYCQSFSRQKLSPSKWLMYMLAYFQSDNKQHFW